MECKICSFRTSFFAWGVILKHRIQYFRCNRCGFIQTEDPYWLDEAYTEAITKSDVGLVSRNIAFSHISAALLYIFFEKKAKFLDYGGGCGLFVRLMRDAGFEFYWHDKFSVNLFATGLEAKNLYGDQYELITALEVFEHLAHPIDEISQMFRISKNILFSTQLIPSALPQPREWWYYAPEHGQHVSFYTTTSLSVIADKFGVNLYTNGESLHLFTEKKISPFLFKRILNPGLAIILGKLWRHRSLLERDYQDAVKRLGHSNGNETDHPIPDRGIGGKDRDETRKG